MTRSTGQIAAPALLGVFMSRHGRLPAFAQRRLDVLIAKRKQDGLTRAEERELSETLNYIDDTSIELLAYAAEQARAGRKPSSESVTHLPLWKRYIDRRLKDLCSR